MDMTYCAFHSGLKNFRIKIVLKNGQKVADFPIYFFPKFAFDFYKMSIFDFFGTIAKNAVT